VVCLSGDGGVQFTLGELASAAEAEARVILLLHDNAGYGEIKSAMIAQNVPPLGVDILTPDLAAIARASGWEVVGAEDPAGLATALEAAKVAGGPMMIRFTDDLRRAFRA